MGTGSREEWRETSDLNPQLWSETLLGVSTKPLAELQAESCMKQSWKAPAVHKYVPRVAKTGFCFVLEKVVFILGLEYQQNSVNVS